MNHNYDAYQSKNKKKIKYHLVIVISIHLKKKLKDNIVFRKSKNHMHK